MITRFPPNYNAFSTRMATRVNLRFFWNDQRGVFFAPRACVRNPGHGQNLLACLCGMVNKLTSKSLASRSHMPAAAKLCATDQHRYATSTVANEMKTLGIQHAPPMKQLLASVSQ